MPADRIQDLLAMSQKTPNKAILWYALGMEYRSRKQFDDAMKAFQQCTTVDPGYVPAYFQGGMTLDEAGKRPLAMEMLKTGIGVARQKGDLHAAGEMESQLELWE